MKKARKAYTKVSLSNYAQAGKNLPTAYSSAPRTIPWEQQQQIQPQVNDMDVNLQSAFYPNLGAPDNSQAALDTKYQPSGTIAANNAPSTTQGIAVANGGGAPQGSAPAAYEDTPKPKFNYGNAALTALLAVDALIPGKKPQSPVVRPGLSYNEHPYGTGSSALARNGMKLSTMGYKHNSPDVGEPRLRIPSNQITMEGVKFPVYGQDEYGNGQMMYPGKNYQFEGKYVDETPVYSQGGLIKRPPKYQAGGAVATTPPTDITRMTPEQITYFNNFNDYVKGQGLQGSTKLNTGGLNEKLYSQYNDSLKTANPLPLRQLTRMAQNEQHFQKDFDVDFAKRKTPQAADVLATSSISPIDDYYGSETSKRYIPVAERVQSVNNRIVSKQNLGYVPNSLNAPKAGAVKKPLPSGAEVFTNQDGDTGYLDPANDQWVSLKRNGGKLQSGGMLKNQYKKGSVHDLSEDEIRSLTASGYKLKFI